MIVYAESNFVLELAFLRSDHEDADRLLHLSETGRIRLVLPAFSLAEPHETLIRRAKVRRSLHIQLSQEIEELSRSRPYADVAQNSRAVTAVLAASGQEEQNRLAVLLERIIAGAEVIPMTAVTIAAGVGFQSSLGLSAQDALVYASVEQHLQAAEGGPRIFVNQNRKDFLTPDILDRLAERDCKLITSFAAARALVDRAVRQPDGERPFG